MPPEDSSSSTNAISRTEFVCLIGAVVVGAVLRLSFPGRIAVEHFDEGVYASNFWFGERDEFSFPARYLYAPPLLPATIEWTMIAAKLAGLRLDNAIPMIPCLVAGIAMIPSLWWVARRWFGPSAGGISAWLVALSDFHASYSRAALTDVPVGLFMLWGIYFTGQALLLSASIKSESWSRREKSGAEPAGYPWREIILAASFTALGWWTKYNGWLPLAVGATGGVLWQSITPAAERRLKRAFLCFGLIASIAVVMWLPVLWGLQQYGGYATVAANHRQYVVGLAGWGQSLMTQAANIGEYENWIGMAQIPAVKLAQPLVWWATAVLALFLWLQRFKSSQQQLVGCLLLAWLGGMTVATPFYYPYPRLILPWLISIWLSIGLFLQIVCDVVSRARAGTNVPPRMMWRPSKLQCLFVAWLVLNCGIRSVCETTYAWQDRTSAKVVAAQIQREIELRTNRRPIADQAIVYVWGEPAIVYMLRASGLDYVGPVANLDFINQRQPIPTFLTFGRQSSTGPEFSEQSRLLAHAPFAHRFEVTPSHLIQMDSPPRDNPSDDNNAVWLYQTGR